MTVELGQTLLYDFDLSVFLCAFVDCCLCAVADYLHLIDVFIQVCYFIISRLKRYKRKLTFSSIDNLNSSLNELWSKVICDLIIQLGLSLFRCFNPPKFTKTVFFVT